MKFVISIETFRGTHCLAGCFECDWSEGIAPQNSFFEKDVRRKAQQHTRQTGHKTWVEKSVATHYTRSEE